MAYIIPDDLVPFANIPADRAAAMIEDASAQAILAAPCLGDESQLTGPQRAAVKSVLRRAILRWEEAGAGGSRKSLTEASGPFQRGETWESSGSQGLFWPSEIGELQGVCQQVTGAAQRAGGVDMVGWGGLLDYDPTNIQRGEAWWVSPAILDPTVSIPSPMAEG